MFSYILNPYIYLGTDMLEVGEMNVPVCASAPFFFVLFLLVDVVSNRVKPEAALR